MHAILVEITAVDNLGDRKDSQGGSRTPTTSARHIYKYGRSKPFLESIRALTTHELCMRVYVYVCLQEIILRIRILLSDVAFLRRANKNEVSLFRRDGWLSVVIARIPSGRNDSSLGNCIRRETEFTTRVEQNGGVVKIDYDIIICARTCERLNCADRCVTTE